MELTKVKQNMGRFVTRKGAGGIYRLTGCILRKSDKGEFFYQAELMDIRHGNSVVICALDDVEKGENQNVRTNL